MQIDSSIYQSIINKKALGKKQVAVLIDPDEYTIDNLKRLFVSEYSNKIDYVFVGGSIIFKDIDICISDIKNHTDKPVVLFPGHSTHISNKADAILLLSLISGRNPELLIGNHIVVAPKLKQSGIEIISTGYMLIENGKPSSVQYMSNTQPIPREKIDIAVATAMAGEMLGLKMIYLEAGSGAAKPVKDEMIKKIKNQINIPLIVGGGLNTAADINSKFESGADLIVVGSAIEKNPDKFSELFQFDK
jgi:phosphoglycerol geranylgeranyltransferase